MQQKEESIDSFYTRLRALAATCDFHDQDREILSQVLHGCVSSRIRRKALKDNLNLKQVLDEARAFELLDSRAAEMEGHTQINSVSSSGIHKHGGQRGISSGNFSRDRNYRSDSSYNTNGSKNHSNQKNNHSSNHGHSRSTHHDIRNRTSSNRSGINICRNCGGHFPHATTTCPAKGKECQSCHEIRHFANVCRSTQHKVRLLRENGVANDVYAEYSDETESENEFVFSLTNTPGLKSPTITIQLIDTPTTFIIDTGATINILDFQTQKFALQTQIEWSFTTNICIWRKDTRCCQRILHIHHQLQRQSDKGNILCC